MNDKIEKTEVIEHEKDDASVPLKSEAPPENDEADAKAKVEAKAIEMGWNPDKDSVDPSKWVSAEEFVARAPLFEKNRKLSRKIKELESSINSLKGHYSKIESIAYEKALKDLKEKKIKAMEEFDHKTVAEIDEEIVDLKSKTARPQEKQTLLPEFVEWKERNPWYDADEEMKEVADKAGRAYALSTPDADPEEVYRYAEKRVREKFPDRFRNKNKSQPSPVESPSRQTKPGKPTWGSLPEHFQRAGDKFVRNGIMTREQYIDDLIKMGEIKGA